ncbi:TPA: hypothetical protein KOS98_003450 [Clostridioides difficile]|uniref:hypothetical protein n=1 Tax=Clostridioides difficile TaxID=1496 RepID=UPI000D1E946B|nr:hypothetical protein [Clostridioides difficile]EGT4968477.1 hypothetical protein [Clostridioides difficile]MBY2550395.1 hypothetical protein [Clostridioides difficile]MDI2927961.1 hypothetical protein [Clostridioides difficile]MDI6365788.1 hypothetical protein [Clostridioides difficile]PTL49669.1 hypothetical protein C5H93_03705 [Clostridioides difficile]
MEESKVFFSSSPKTQIFLGVRSIDKLKEIIQKANTQANQLQETISELEYFEIEFELKVD